MTKPSQDKQKPLNWGLDVVYQHAAQIEAELVAKKLSHGEYLQTTMKDNCNSAVQERHFFCSVHTEIIQTLHCT